MKYQKYPEYKESGIEWLGEVPKHWEIKPIKSLFSRTKRTGYKNETLLSVYREYGVIVKSSRDDNRNKESDDLSPYQLVNIGDLVINKMKAWQGSLAISEHRGIVSPAYYIYEPLNSNNLLNNNFIHNQIRSKYFIQSYKNFSKGIRVGQWDLESELFTRLNLFLPPFDEQRKISEFIQREITKIDNLISKQEQLIQLLEEQRKAVILQAITKGLNLDLSMKQSGIDWIGAMPKKWQLKRLKQIANVVLGKMICNENQGDMLLKPYLKSKNIQWLNVNLNSVDEMWFSAKELDMYKLHKDDLILSEGGEVGKTCIWNNELDECYIQNSAHKVTLCEGYNAHYYLYFFYSMGHLGQFDRVINKVSIAHLTKEKLLNIPVLIPSIDEQNQIVDFIESENIKINNLINQQSKLIEKLKEYRTSIISHAVTGKIDVREAL